MALKSSIRMTGRSLRDTVESLKGSVMPFFAPHKSAQTMAARIESVETQAVESSSSFSGAPPTLEMSLPDRESFVRSIISPPEPGNALKKALALHGKLISR